MTNRGERPDVRQAAIEAAADYRCPDCRATTELIERTPNVFVLEVAHDATCPSFRGIKG